MGTLPPSFSEKSGIPDEFGSKVRPLTLDDLKSKSVTSLVRVACFLYVPAALLPCLWIGWRQGTPEVYGRIIGNNVGRDLLIGMGTGLTLVAIWRILARMFEWARTFERMFGRLLGSIPLWAALALALLSGIGEEIIFRALMQPWSGIWIASVAFGLLHFPPTRELLNWPIMAFIVGLLFGWLFDWTGAALAPICAHFTVNLINLWIFGRLKDPIADLSPLALHSRQSRRSVTIPWHPFNCMSGFGRNRMMKITQGNDGWTLCTPQVGSKDADLNDGFRDAVAKGHNKILADLSELEYVNSSAIGVFVGISTLLNETNGEIVVVRPSKNVRIVLELIGFKFEGEGDSARARVPNPDEEK